MGRLWELCGLTSLATLIHFYPPSLALFRCCCLRWWGHVAFSWTMESAGAFLLLNRYVLHKRAWYLFVTSRWRACPVIMLHWCIGHSWHVAYDLFCENVDRHMVTRRQVLSPSYSHWRMLDNYSKEHNVAHNVASLYWSSFMALGIWCNVWLWYMMTSEYVSSPSRPHYRMLNNCRIKSGHAMTQEDHKRGGGIWKCNTSNNYN